LAAGCFSMGIAVFLCCGVSSKSALRLAAAFLGGGLMGLAVAVHLSFLFCVGIALLVVPMVGARSWSDAIAAGIGVMVGFGLSDSLVYYLWTGDPLYQFKVIQASHFANLADDPNSRSAFEPDGSMSWSFFLQPIRDVMVSQEFCLLGSIALLGGLVFWRRMNKSDRALFAMCVVSWLWLSYGSHSPTHYEPLPGTVPYWGGLMLPMIVLAAFAIDHLPGRYTAALATSLLIALHVAVLSSSGSWGQSTKVSRELLAVVDASPDTVFVTDDMTVRELLVVNAFRRPDNLYLTPVSADVCRIAVPQASSRELDRPDAFLLVNELNLKRCNGASQQWIGANRGDVARRAETQYRTITYLLPETYRTSHSWTVRRPAAEVCRLSKGRFSQGEDVKRSPL
jgi:hypothetical protein